MNEGNDILPAEEAGAEVLRAFLWVYGFAAFVLLSSIGLTILKVCHE